MSDLTDLYQELILDHNRRPRNSGGLEAPSCSADGHNPLCGDRIHLDVTVRDDTITDISFTGSGCAISTASASLMTEAVKGASIERAGELFGRFHDLVRGEPVDDEASLGKLAAFAGVSRYPMRVKCAILAWHTLQAALHGAREPVTTE